MLLIVLQILYFFGPLQIIQIKTHYEKGDTTSGRTLDSRSFKVSSSSIFGTIITTHLGTNIGDVEDYYFYKQDKGKIRIYIVTTSSSTWIPYGVEGVNQEYETSFKINRKIKYENIEIYVKAVDDKNFSRLETDIPSDDEVFFTF